MPTTDVGRRVGCGAARSADTAKPCMSSCCVRVAARVFTNCDPNVLVSRYARMIFRGPRVQKPELGSTLGPDNIFRCFGHDELHIIRVV